MNDHFKFLHSQHTHFLLSGLVRFCSLDWYRYLEESTGDHQRGDRTEGIAEYSGGIRIPGTTAPEEHSVALGRVNRMSPPGMRMVEHTGEGALDIGSVVVECPHCLVFCISCGERSELAAEFHAPPAGYDACIRVLDLELSSEKISCGRIVELEDAPVSGAFDGIATERVVYELREAKLDDDRVIELSPFRKRSIYASQQEVRIALRPKDHRFRDQVTIRIDKPDEVFELQYRADAADAPSPDSKGELDRIKAWLSNLGRSVEAWWRDHSPGLPRDPHGLFGFVPTEELKKLHKEYQAAKVALAEKCAGRFRKKGLNLYWSMRLLGIRSRDIDGALGTHARFWEWSGEDIVHLVDREHR